MGGSADGGCPVSSTWDNYGGRKLDDGGCLTAVDMFEVKKFYGQVIWYQEMKVAMERKFHVARKPKVEYETFKEKCERHNGSVKASEMELVCVCLRDEQFGEFCEKNADLCSERKWCLNGGTCRNYRGNYRCHCANGFSGMNCTDEIGSCEKAAFQNDATRLQVTNNAYRCDCSYRHGGTLCEKELSITEIYIRLITNSLAFQVALIIIVLIIILFGCFILIMAIRGHHIRKETSFERVLRTGLERRKAVIAQYDAKHKFGNEKGNTQKSSSSAVGQEVHCGKLRIWNKSPVRLSDSEAASGSRKKSKSKKARVSHRDASRRRKLKGRNSRSRRSRSQSNSRHRSRSRSGFRSRSRSRSNSAS
ncbi:Delta-like protein 1 [Trichinella sp. T9]|nr:Delta-like protein 1 [Trichinella sp. T9]